MFESPEKVVNRTMKIYSQEFTLFPAPYYTVRLVHSAEGCRFTEVLV